MVKHVKKKNKNNKEKQNHHQKINKTPLRVKHAVHAFTWYTIRTIPISSSCSSSISTSVTISIRIRQSVSLSVASIKLFFKNAQQAGNPVVQTHVQDKLQSGKRQEQDLQRSIKDF